MLRKPTVNMIQQKETKLKELQQKSESAIQIVNDTINNLNRTNEEINGTLLEVMNMLNSLESIKAELNAAEAKNEKIMKNFSSLLCVD